MNVIRNMSEQARANLRNNLHKVAAVKAQQEGVTLARDQVTIKEAVYLLGVDLWRSWLEKRAMLEGLTSLRQLER